MSSMSLQILRWFIVASDSAWQIASQNTVTHLEGDAEEDLKDFKPSDKVESA